MTYEAVIIGAGHNGLATGVILANAGWKVLILERNVEAGGAVRTAEVTLPGYKHDLMAANLNLFAGSPFFAEFGDELIANGLEFAPIQHPFSSVFPDGKFVGVSTDLEETIRGIGEFSENDAEAWRRLNERFNSEAPHLFGMLGTPLPSMTAVRQILRGARALGRKWPADLVRLVLQSTREFTEEHFTSREIQSLTAAWGMHLDYPPDVSGGALFPYLETFANGVNGMVIGKGGANTMIDALVSLFESLGGELRTSTPVKRVMTRGRKAIGVELGDGEIVTSSRAVVANLTPKVLFNDLVGKNDVDPRFRQKVAGFKHAPGTMMVHLALDDALPWTSRRAQDFAYVHIGPYMDDMGLAYQQAVAGLLPQRPFLVVGQPTSVDRSRAPEGKHVGWIQVRVVPSQIKGDSVGQISTTDWAEAKEPMADRVLDILEEYAPGTSKLVLGRHAMSPDDLQATNPNLIGGDSLGGSHHLMQHFFLRPFPGYTKYRTPIRDLYMCGAGTWPGAGVGAGSGFLLGKMLTKPKALARIRSLITR